MNLPICRCYEQNAICVMLSWSLAISVVVDKPVWLADSNICCFSGNVYEWMYLFLCICSCVNVKYFTCAVQEVLALQFTRSKNTHIYSYAWVRPDMEAYPYETLIPGTWPNPEKGRCHVGIGYRRGGGLQTVDLHDLILRRWSEVRNVIQGTSYKKVTGNVPSNESISFGHGEKGGDAWQTYASMSYL